MRRLTNERDFARAVERKRELVKIKSERKIAKLQNKAPTLNGNGNYKRNSNGDEKSRSSNCGFVAFMSRRDAERALKANKHREDMRVGWGKSVELPPHPIYIPNSLLKLYLPPPSTGLPFNAQPPAWENVKKNYSEKDLDDLLFNCSVKVTIPLNKKILMLVHRMIEFVVREGPMFEAFIMNKELGNPDFNFLFDYQSPIHVYYRWRLYSILVGDNKKIWSLKPFRMFKGGSIWLPPVAPNYTEGMPDILFNSNSNSVDDTKLSEGQSKRLIALLRKLTMSRPKIAEAMVFCLNHDRALRDVVQIVVESMENPETSPLKMVARLYLLSDVVFNSSNGSNTLDLEQADLNLIGVFGCLRERLEKLKSTFDRDNFSSRVLKVLRQWDVYKVVSSDFIRKAESFFVSAPDTLVTEPPEDDNSSTDEPLDGANLLRRSLKNDLGPDVITTTNLGEKKALNKNQILEYFVPSKWDTVDPEEVQAQAMSTEKMYYMELEDKLKSMYKEKEEGSRSGDDSGLKDHKKGKKGKGKRKRSKDRDGGFESKRGRSKKR